MVTGASALGCSRISNLCDQAESAPSPGVAASFSVGATASTAEGLGLLPTELFTVAPLRPANSLATRDASSSLLSLETPFSCSRLAHSKSCFCVYVARRLRSSTGRSSAVLIPSTAAAPLSTLSSISLPDPMGGEP